MKLVILILCVSLISAALVARDLSSVARKERARREAVRASRPESTAFTNADLDAYSRATPPAPAAPPAKRPDATTPPRDLAKDEARWRKETARHERELARLDAGIRRLEWRLQERRAQARRRGRLLEADPALELMEESLESLRDERDQRDADFRERARKEGAFPGWLR